jgi:hypothetical protein
VQPELAASSIGMIRNAAAADVRTEGSPAEDPVGSAWMVTVEPPESSQAWTDRA